MLGSLITKKIIGIVCVAITGIGISGGVIAFAAETNSNLISEENAKAIALEHRKIQESQASDFDIDLDRDFSEVTYEVEFTFDGVEYDYEIDAFTGEILSYEYETIRQEESIPTEEEGYISEEEAKAIVFAHAGVTDGDIASIFIKLDFDDSVAEYEIEFWVGNEEYEYEVNALTGEITSYDIDVDDDMDDDDIDDDDDDDIDDDDDMDDDMDDDDDTVTNENYIGENSAISIAMNHANVSLDQATNINWELGSDNDIPVYEVEWEVDSTEYEYKINALDGSVLESKVDAD